MNFKRHFPLFVLGLFALPLGALAACAADTPAGPLEEEPTADGGADGGSKKDAASGSDSASPDDASTKDASTKDGSTKPDAGPPPVGIAGARAAADSASLTIPITDVVVTYLKPQIGNATSDPAGFTVQADPTGPALFVSVDPATLTPPAAVGDKVSFTVTTMGTVSAQRRAKAITGYTRSATGTDIASLIQDVTAKTDLLTNQDGYDSELVSLTGTLGADFASSGQGFQAAQLDTTGVTGMPAFLFRAPATLISSLDLVKDCTVAIHAVPFSLFNTQTEIGAYVPADVTVTACPAPSVMSAAALSGTSVSFKFTRKLDPATVLADGSQFTFDNGLTATAATVVDDTVTVTTSMQDGTKTYTGTVATTLKDLSGSALAAPTTAMFPGFVTPATVKINEINANVEVGATKATCDLIELRVTSGGSMTGFKLQERNTPVLTFPAFSVATNDIIVVHFASGNAVCNAGGATQETASKADQAAATYAGNYDTAYDFWITDGGITNTDNVITLYDAAAVPAIHDALFVSNDPAATDVAAATETQAGKVGAANQWSPALAAYVNEVFRTNAADDLDATGSTAAGTSIQRLNDTDTNAKTDWSTGAGAASTFGLLNVGQNLL